MFSVGELMIYGTNGVCRVDEICNSPFDSSDTRLFYKLTPTPDRSNLVIYTPVDNDKVIMRPPHLRRGGKGFACHALRDRHR